jgi:hypothetical protein
MSHILYTYLLPSANNTFRNHNLVSKSESNSTCVNAWLFLLVWVDLVFDNSACKTHATM